MVISNKADRLTLPTTLRVLMPGGHVEVMKLETYLAGVVAAESVAPTLLEALKAQTVASRTYAAIAHRHPEQNADVCTTSHCQRWKRVDPVVAPEIYRAVSETWGIIALYDDQPINTFFFEHCDGRTRNSEDMLMPQIPYLRGVDCTCGHLDLKGHGVGMCKRGANKLAQNGATFDQILQHYYRGISVVQITPAAQTAAPVSPPPSAEPEPKPRGRGKKSATTKSKPTQVARPITTASIAQAIRTAQTPSHRPPAPKETPSRVMARPPASRVEHIPPAPKPVPDVSPREPLAPTPPAVASRPVKMRRIQVDHLPGQRMIAGSLAEEGLPITITDANENRIALFTGHTAAYGDGGFEASVKENGRYTISIDGQVIEVDVQDETVFIHAI